MPGQLCAVVERALQPAVLYDCTWSAGVLRVFVDQPGGLDLDTVAEAARRVSAALDEEDPLERGWLPGSHYTLEVGSPGLERPLRRPEHFRASLGCEVVVRTNPGSEGDRRVHGILRSADESGFEVEVIGDAPGEGRKVHDGSRSSQPRRRARADGLGSSSKVHAPSGPSPSRRFAYGEVERARTVFRWGQGA